ncbi:MAG: multidrug effflux MFS transporter [Zoogloeaceae bacterium]|nr:multidrug effflux MFS transporter [Zoogloeaceae bacterium]
MKKSLAPTLGMALLMAALGAIGPFSIDTYLPAFQEIGESLAAGKLEVAQTLSIYLFTFGLMTLWHGALSDSFGRRRVILVGLVIYAVSTLGCAFSPNIATLWAMRALQGLAAGAGMVVSRAIVRDLYSGATAQRLMAQIAMMFAIAPAIAPMIGGWLLHWLHWRAIFIFLALAAAVLWLVCLKRLPESLPEKRRQPFAIKPLLGGYKLVLANLPFLLISLGIGVYFNGYFIYILSAPTFIREQLGLKETDFIWLFGPAMVCLIIGATLSARLAGKVTQLRIVQLAFAIMTASAIANFLVSWLIPESRILAVVPVALYNLGIALAMPVNTLRALDLFPANRRGMAASCQSFLQTSVGAAVAAFLVPHIWHARMDMAWGMVILLTFGGLLIIGHFRLTPAHLEGE